MNFAIDFLDLAVIAVVLISAIYATYRGLVSESLSVFGWIAAAYATLFFGPICAAWVRSMMEPRWLGELVGFVAVFLIVLIPLHFASSRIAVNVKRSQIGTLDSVLGTGFGILRGIAIVGISFIIYMMIFEGPPPAFITKARLYPLIYASAEIVASVTPVDKPRVDGRRNPRANEDKPERIEELLQQDQPFKAQRPADQDEKPAGSGQEGKFRRNDPLAPVLEKAQNDAAPSKSHQEKAGNEAEDEPKRGTASAKPKKHSQHAKKTYGATDRHALDRLIETSHGEDKR